MTMAALSISCSNSAKQNSIRTKSSTGIYSAPPAVEVEKRGHALLRVIGAIPTGASFDLFVDEHKEFDKVQYRSVSPYRELNAQKLKLSLRLADVRKNDAIAEQEVSIDKGIHYSLIAMPNENGNSINLVLFNDEFAWPSWGRARIRVIQAGQGVGDVDLYLGDRQSFLVSAPGGAASICVNTKPRKGVLEFYSKDKNVSLLTIPDVAFEKERVYTIILVGRPKSIPRLDAFTIEDQIQASSV
jgi:hypothetical protein